MADEHQREDGWTGTINGKPTTGASASREKRTSFRDIDLFAEISGDRNPLHFDQAFAEGSVFGRLIVPGGVITGLLNAIVAEDLPGPGSVFLEVNWRFIKSVGVGEAITGLVKIATVRDDKPICTIDTRPTQQI